MKLADAPPKRQRAAFPMARPRRLRRSAGLRDLVRETTLEPTDLVYPLFV